MPEAKKIKEGKIKRTVIKKAAKVTPPVAIEKKIAPEVDGKYIETVGRRKTSIARVRLFSKGEKGFLVNEKPYNVYFPTKELQDIALSPLERMRCVENFKVQVRVRGGGIHSQAEAVKHAISRALVLFNADFKKRLKRTGFLTRDPRMRERKKFGLKRARKAPQWAKR